MDRLPADGPSPARAPTFRDVPWRLSDVIVALTPVTVIRVLTELGRPEDWAAIPRWVGPVVLVAELAWLLGCPAWLARRRGASVPQLPRVRSVLIEGSLAVPLLLVTWFTLGAAILIWEALAGAPVRPQNPLEGGDPSRLAFVLVLLAAATAGPVAEEAMFRGLVYNALRRRMPVVVAVVVQALAFGFLHPHGLVHGALASGIGLVLGVVYQWRKTLLTPIAMHVLQNTAAALMAYAAATAAANTPLLGVNGEPADGGCRVTQVSPGSGAEEAGIRVGDVIRTVDGRRVADVRDVAAVVRRHRPGGRLAIEFIRDGEPRRVEVELRRRE